MICYHFSLIPYSKLQPLSSLSPAFCLILNEYPVSNELLAGILKTIWLSPLIIDRGRGGG